MRAPDDFPEASGDEVKSSSPSPANAVDGAKNGEDEVVNHSFEPPNTTERRTPPRPVYRYAAAAATATSAPSRPPMPPTTSSSRHTYYNPGYYAYGQYSPHYYHAAGYNCGHHHHHHHPAGYRPTATQGKDGASLNTVDLTPITPRDDDRLPPSVTMSPTPPASFPPQRRDDTGSNSARLSTPPPVSSEAIPDSDINDKDVLSGRGGGTNNHPGNKEFRSLVDQYRSEYVLSKKWAKREIARNIVESIRSKGGRFLKKEGSMWRDIGDQKAREKTSQALREGLAAKMRAAYAESSGASMSPNQASSTSQRHRPESAPAEAPTPSSRPSDHHHEADYYHIPPHGYQHYSPDSVTGHYHLDPTSSASYEPYDYAYPYEYSPEAYGPPPPSSPIKRRRLSYSTYASGEPKQTEAV